MSRPTVQKIRRYFDAPLIITVMKISKSGHSVQFGLASLHQYVDDPEEVYFVKSPKSFLGANGLKPQQVALFEDLVCAMMLHIKQQAQSQLSEQITQAVIGRPINFQGLGGDDANAQAQGILERAATRAGFNDVVFQFEPVAAGLDFEATLNDEKRVLVVDIGGGTTDCSLLLMGPQWRQKPTVRIACWATAAAVSAVTIWISPAFKCLMPLLGMGGETEKALRCRYCRGMRWRLTTSRRRAILQRRQRTYAQ